MSLRIPSFTEALAVSRAHGRNSDAPGLWGGIVGAWLGLQGGGFTLFDVSGFDNHGALTNMDPAADWPTTQYGPVLDFDGSDDYVNIPSRVLLSAQSNVTIGGVFYLRSSEDTEVLITGNKAGSNAGDWQVSQLAGRAIRFFYDNATSLDTGTSIFSLNTWFSVFCTLNAGGATIYVDGVAVNSNATAGVVGGNGQDVRIGRQTNDSGELDGRMRMGGIWNRALAPSEIRHLYHDPLAPFRLAPRPATCFVPPAPPAGAIMKQLQTVNLGADLFDGALVL